ncbi:MAG: acyloxyacyl hydrolase [Pseudomonadota bacterium]|uniref:acyloxyacyl hydrolase n=1 Tax=Methylophaga aminisulfidivorans TaxID=230105 RepID=UPI0024E1A724|nr:acyloxyacyl hydrolase [Methylophaga aminisulfidivorans]MEC9412329.1 acyloxyacyl hydrolase [Pseudomonadota bacterium]
MNKHLRNASIALTLLLPSTAFAEQESQMALSVGAFEVFDDNTAAEIGVEYRFSPQASAFNLIPTLGATLTSDGGYWGYAGVRYDIYLNNNWILTPNFAIAAYEQGGGVDLGYDIEFRTGAELAYQFSDKSRLGLGLYHLSNANIGENNPGAESLILSYSF